jgi:hypothetical protein
MKEYIWHVTVCEYSNNLRKQKQFLFILNAIIVT